MISVSIRLTSPAFIFSTVISLLTLVSIAAGAPSQDGSHRRQKRHILQMCELISTHTNRGCLDYNNYGCFCGLGNMGSRPVDGVDRCCRIHDQCYGNVACFWIYPQFVGYSVNCSSNAECTCTDSRIFSPCAYTTCQCDLEFAQCLGRHKYNHTFSDFNRSECNRPGRRLRRAGRRRRRRMAKKERRELRELTKRQQKKLRSSKE